MFYAKVQYFTIKIKIYRRLKLIRVRLPVRVYYLISTIGSLYCLIYPMLNSYLIIQHYTYFSRLRHHGLKQFYRIEHFRYPVVLGTALAHQVAGISYGSRQSLGKFVIIDEIPYKIYLSILNHGMKCYAEVGLG